MCVKRWQGGIKIAAEKAVNDVGKALQEDGLAIKFHVEALKGYGEALMGDDSKVVVVNCCFTSLFGTNGLLSDIAYDKNVVVH